MVGDDSLIIFNHNQPINALSYNPKNDFKYPRELQFRSMTWPIILFPVLCHMNGVHIGEVTTLLSDESSENTHAIKISYLAYYFYPK